MRKTALLMVLLALLEGSAGFILRGKELLTIFPDNSGLAAMGEPISTAVMGVVSLALITALLFSLIAMSRTAPRDSYEKAFGYKGPLLIVVYFLASAAVVAGAILYIRDARTLYGGARLVRLILGIFGVLSGVSFLTSSVGAFKRKLSTFSKALSVIPPLFACMWLVLSYQVNATNPVMLEYVYWCVALAAAALGFYYETGYVYGRNKPKRTVGAHFFAVVLCILSIADQTGMAETLMLAGMAIMLTVNMDLFTVNSSKQTQKTAK